MNKILRNILLIVAILLLLIGCSFWGGYKYYKNTHPITHTTDSILIYDTITHVIDHNHYIQKIDTLFYPDSVFVPSDVDTAAILYNYFAIYLYNRHWNDSIIQVDLVDTITQNKISGSDFLKYKILRPQEVIINTTTVNNYTKYIYGGINVPINKWDFTEANIIYAGPKGYIGLGYIPGQNTTTIKMGIPIIKIR